MWISVTCLEASCKITELANSVCGEDFFGGGRKDTPWLYLTGWKRAALAALSKATNSVSRWRVLPANTSTSVAEFEPYLWRETNRSCVMGLAEEWHVQTCGRWGEHCCHRVFWKHGGDRVERRIVMAAMKLKIDA